jgi:hypothetical protein
MRYFKPTNPNEISHKQFPIYFDYMDEECKGLLDILFINTEEKYIQPIDLKTTTNVWSFPKSFLRYGYQIQAGFYHIATD